MLRSKLHYQKGFNLIPFSYKMHSDGHTSGGSSTLSTDGSRSGLRLLVPESAERTLRCVLDTFGPDATTGTAGGGEVVLVKYWSFFP